MSLSSRAKDKALNFFAESIAQADPSVRLESGSPVRALLLLPAAMIFAAVFQSMEVLKGLYLSRYESLSDRDVDLLASNVMASRLEGSRSTTTLRVYVSAPVDLTLRVFPYFSSLEGVEYSPGANTFVPRSSFLVDAATGEFYTSVRVFSTTLGAASFSDAEAITGFSNLPSAVTRVTNPNATTGGRPRESNADFYERISINDSTPAQRPGLTAYILNNYESFSDILIVGPGDDEMERDELWTVDGVTPNMSRQGTPFALHTDLGTLNFDKTFGRAYSASGAFDQSMVGRRIAVDGDIEVFRIIRSVPSANDAVLTGPIMSGSASAKVWGSGPRPMAASDCYVWSPSVEIRSIDIDNRFFISPAFSQSNPTKFYYTIAPGFGYNVFGTSGRLVFNQGGVNEAVANVTSVGSDITGNFLQLESAFTGTFETTDVLSFWDMDTVELGADTAPMIYLLSVDLLDPSSRQSTGRIPRSNPGNFDEPGWYISATDPAEIFSSRETKKLNIDRKHDLNGFRAYQVSSGTMLSASSARFVGADFTGAEGREFVSNLSNSSLNGPGDDVTGAVATRNVAKTELTVSGLGARYFTDLGYRVASVTVRGYSAGPTLEFTEVIADARVAGDIISRPSGGFDLADTSDTYEVDIAFSAAEDLLTHAGTGPFELVATRCDGTDITFSEDLVVISDGTDILTTMTNISAPYQGGEFGAAPVRLTYATIPDVPKLQRVIEDEEGLLIDDTLIRSYFPSTIDMSISYRGSSTAAQLRSRFIQLISDAVRRDPDSLSTVRVDLSNVIAALDDEGLADAIGLRPEVKITNTLPDGEIEVRYLNPSSTTLLNLSHFGASSPGDASVKLRKVGASTPPGRGRVILGGQDDSRFEMLPYEAVIEATDHFEFILRGTYEVEYDHASWEPAVACARDYDPALELTEGAIVIPRQNRPYLRNLSVEKTS